MNILIDTSVWSLAFRRKTESFNATEKTLIAELAELIREVRCLRDHPKAANEGHLKTGQR